MTQLLQTIVLGLLLGGVYALAASGLSLIFGVMRVVNIAHGAFLILSAFLTYWLWDAFGLDPLLGIVVATPMMFGLGWLTYRLLVSPVRSAPMASTVLLSFGIALVLEGVMGEVWGNNSSAIRPSYADESFAMGGIFFPKAQVHGGLIAVIVLILLWSVLTKTWLGRAIRAAATNPSSAELVGVKVASVAALVFGIGIAAAGAAGSITGVLYPFIPGSHYQWIARLLAIVVFGGLGSINGAVLGGLLFGVAETMVSAYGSPAWSTAVPYAIVFAVLLIRPQGLLGTRLREDTVATT
ncbi:branched-chain amino acid ABC transporter permease [Streptomyces sp. CA-249302]|uniref:branched-chain amino acid ABC transporter permease n=1 Tax=Streptomyces sp. CA-249302 TaxID=3240058 RepID=UPI003D8AF17F